MQIIEKDKACLWDIKEACKDVLLFIENKNFKDFSEDKRTRFAVERQLLVIGEAANHLSESFQEKTQHIPWKKIIGLRNVIAHDYGEILVERIWLTATTHIAELLGNIKKLLD